ncbi:MAG: OmpA family protein [Bacteroidales bacterium]|nr:OmpA family protein [Bacteroidales bacterium]
MKKFLTIILCGSILASCGLSKLASGSLIGAGAGSLVGAGVGYLIGGNGQAAAIGAAVGTAVGGGTGAIIGNAMDKKAAQLAELENAQVETITDVNGLTAIKVTFDNGILFDFGKSTLQDPAKEQLDKFVAGIADLEQTNITVYGHTDNVGSDAANQKVSEQRADAVAKYLNKHGIATKRIHAAGLSKDFPVADNDTDEGRAKNRRVEIYVSANEEMIKAAEEGKQI